MRYSDVTPQQIYLNRRRFLAAALALPIPAAAATLNAAKTIGFPLSARRIGRGLRSCSLY